LKNNINIQFEYVIFYKMMFQDLSMLCKFVSENT